METEEIFVAIQEAAEIIATPNWADKLSLLVSVLAILVAAGVAIYVALKQNKIAERQTEIVLKQSEIAEQQNSIVLFEKQYLVFIEITKVTKLGLAIRNCPKVKLQWVLDSAVVNFGYDFNVDTNNPQRTRANPVVANRTLAIIKQAKFLFPRIEKDVIDKLCDKFYDFFDELVAEVLKTPDMTIEQFSSATKSDFIAACEEFQSKYSLHEVILCPSPNPPTNPPSSSSSPKWATPTSTPPT